MVLIWDTTDQPPPAHEVKGDLQVYGFKKKVGGSSLGGNGDYQPSSGLLLQGASFLLYALASSLLHRRSLGAKSLKGALALSTAGLREPTPHHRFGIQALAVSTGKPPCLLFFPRVT